VQQSATQHVKVLITLLSHFHPTNPTPDVPTILSLIHELAAYEKASDKVLSTETLLAETLAHADSNGT
jgi:hypothetical protein